MADVLILGGAGQLGTALRAVYSDRAVVAPPRSMVDVEVPASIAWALEAYRPSAVINCTAFHHVETCESRPDRAFAVNALAVDAIAGTASAAGAKFVTVSTDYVFDGTAGRPYVESDAVNPLSAYGASKVAGEFLTARHQGWHAVVRTSGLYALGVTSNKGYTFIERILQNAERGEALRIVDDIIFSPSFAPDVARAIRRIIEDGESGIYHVTNSGSCSWYAFAREALRMAGIAAEPQAVSSTTYASPVRRPQNSALAHAALGRLGIEMRSWQDALREFVFGRAGARSST